MKKGSGRKLKRKPPTSYRILKTAWMAGKKPKRSEKEGKREGQ